MLQTESVRDSLWNLLKELQGSKIFDNYFLVGGTALSLQLGHRISDDIDLFTRAEINKDEIFDFLNNKYNGKYQIVNIQNIILQVIVNEIKVDFVKYDYELIENVKTEQGIKYLGKKDISAMKLMAVANRGNQAKDFIDIYYLLREISLEDMFKYYKQKYKQNDISAIKRSLVYFDDVTESNWNAVKLLHEKLIINNIKEKIIDEMNRYNKKVIGNI
ncbi:nucleotidyl transferase AbiEii/AbiGii toxin family protein [Treponema sp. OttesenSCG-928-L16]|nr:nucleotidyl transferase AbiEii/AbiGii toxin family protein [Treponema sp. OttesenSCG-928-L16]